jgi:hypothetical protein
VREKERGGGWDLGGTLKPGGERGAV